MQEKLKGPLPPRWFARLVVVFSGTVWLAVAASGLFNPDFLSDLADFQLTSTTGRNEFRAMYGGLCAAIAALHFVAAIRAQWLIQALVATIVLDVGLSTGRIFSIATDGVPGPVALGLLAGELLLIGLCGGALWRLQTAARAAKKAADRAPGLGDDPGEFAKVSAPSSSPTAPSE